jgi:hypothetical protein
MVARVKHLAQTEAWANEAIARGELVRYVLLLDAAVRIQGRCHWAVEVRAGERLWKRFLVPEEGGPAVEARPRD